MRMTSPLQMLTVMQNICTRHDPPQTNSANNLTLKHSAALILSAILPSETVTHIDREVSAELFYNQQPGEIKMAST